MSNKIRSVKAQGNVEKLDRQGFIDALAKTYKPTVYAAKKGLFKKKNSYLMVWQEKNYYTVTNKPYEFTDFVEVVEVGKIIL